MQPFCDRLAALAVVIIDYDRFGIRNLFGGGSNSYHLANTFISLGIYGPVPFFVPSRFALSASLEKKRDTPD
jgi:hypothetical protein